MLGLVAVRAEGGAEFKARPPVKRDGGVLAVAGLEPEHRCAGGARPGLDAGQQGLADAAPARGFGGEHTFHLGIPIE